MDDRPKIIIKIQRLYFGLSVIFFINAILAFMVIIYVASLADVYGWIGLSQGCAFVFGIDFISSLGLSIFSFKLWRAMKKDSKSVVAKGLALAIGTLLLFIGPVIFILWSLIDTRAFLSTFSWDNLILFVGYFFPFLIIIFDIIIITISLTTKVRKYCKTPSNDR